MDTHQESHFVCNGLYLLADLPIWQRQQELARCCPDLHNYEGAEVWHCPQEDHTFTGDTFIDGSNVPCMPMQELNRAGYSVVNIVDQTYDEEMVEAETPDDDDGAHPICSCRNRRNPHHQCVSACVEIAGCDMACRQKRKPQKHYKPNVIQALYASLAGEDQSTPRSEAMAMYQAVRYGISPQVIISDHINHVRDFIRFAAGSTTTPLHPKKPNVDIWRNTYLEIMRRGGLGDIRPDRLWMAWKRSHTRAHRNESNLDRNWRRGNTAADDFANMGRELHYPIHDIVSNVKYLADNATKWIRWVGTAAALQFSSLFDGCDHHLPEGTRGEKNRRQIKVQLPEEAAVLRRMPWAVRSLGTIEYVEDIRKQSYKNQNKDADERHPTGE